MIQIRSSSSNKSNRAFINALPPDAEAAAAAAAATPKRGKRESGPGNGAVGGNVAWLKEVWATLDAAESVAVVLVGGTTAPHVRLRQAQSHLRHDFTPSHWSHALLAWGDDLKAVWEAPLVTDQLPWPNDNNGLAKARLDAYDSMTTFPNVALIAVPVSVKDVAKQTDHLRKTGRLGMLDNVELLHAWLGFLWGVGRAANPLVDGLGVPAVAAIEVILAAAGYELTPNVASRTSCPEAVWQSAKWWQDWHERDERKGLKGGYRVRHEIRG